MVPTVDWNYPYGNQYRGDLASVDLGIERMDAIDNDRRDIEKVAEALLRPRALSASCRTYISNLTFSHYPDDVRKRMNADSKNYQKAAAKHYLCRLFSQLSAAREPGSFLVLSEDDLRILREVGTWMADPNNAAIYLPPKSLVRSIAKHVVECVSTNIGPAHLRELFSTTATALHSIGSSPSQLE